MESDIKYLNEERVKLWARIEELQKAIAQQGADSQLAIEQLSGKFGGDVLALKNALAAVDKLAKEKLTENGEVALQAAKDAVARKDAIIRAADEINTIRGRVLEASKQVETIQEYASKSRECAEASQKDADKLAALRKSIDAEMVEFGQRVEKSKQSAADTTASCSTAGQQKQLVLELANKVAADVAGIKTDKEKSDSILSDLEALKSKITDELHLQVEHLTTLNSDNSSSLKKLYDDNSEALRQLNEKFKEELKKRTDEIDDMIPGAMTAGLATAFAKRRDTQQKTRWLWGVLLIISTALIVIFGIVQSLGLQMSVDIVAKSIWGLALQSAHGMTWYSRAIILAGLVFFEEFARKNFNISSRLEESYAYKAVVFSTYYGYKKDLLETQSTDENNAVSQLVDIVLKKLEDEPGKTVFDKEKHEIGAGAFLDRVAPTGGDSPTQKAVENISKGTMFSKISWQVVVLAAVIGATIISTAIIIGHFLPLKI